MHAQLAFFERPNIFDIELAPSSRQCHIVNIGPNSQIQESMHKCHRSKEAQSNEHETGHKRHATQEAHFWPKQFSESISPGNL
jgi:hypothetical protein